MYTNVDENRSNHSYNNNVNDSDETNNDNAIQNSKG